MQEFVLPDVGTLPLKTWDVVNYFVDENWLIASMIASIVANAGARPVHRKFLCQH